MSLANHLHQDLINCLTKAKSLIASVSGPIEDYPLDLKIDPDINDQNKSSRQLLIALSGGSDSTALLVALARVASSFNFKLFACHINHHLRGNESLADENFCLQLCKSLQIDCQILSFRSNQQGKHASESLLREKRYELLINFAKSREIPFLLTGHTLDDQAETMLFRLFRGTALTGLKGIPHTRQIDESLSLLRPLLNLSKKQCQHFLAQAGIIPRQDSSNANSIYTRNYIRHQVLPVINQRFPDINAHLDSLRQIISADDNFLNELSTTAYAELTKADADNWPLSGLLVQPLSLQRRIVALALQKRSIAVSFQLLEKILALCSYNSSLQYLNLNQHWRLKRQAEYLHWQQIQPRLPHIIDLQPVEVKIPGLVTVPELEVALLVEKYEDNAKPSFPDSRDYVALVDLSLVKLPLFIRPRRPGDRITPLGMSKSIKLKKYLHTHKNHKSFTRPFCHTLLIADQEEVLWLPGTGLSNKIKVSDTPSHKLQWLTLKPD